MLVRTKVNGDWREAYVWAATSLLTRCRCTGYQKVLDAVFLAAERMGTEGAPGQ